MQKAIHGCEQRGSLTVETSATIKRHLLASYIDLLFASVAVYLLAYFFAVEGWLGGYGIYLPSTGFAIVARTLPRLAIGRRFLSISDTGFVDRALVDRGSFWLMLLATLFVLDGTKQLVRWTEFTSWPVLGQQLQSSYQPFVAFALGLLSICAGYWVFKLDWRGFWLALALLGFGLLNALMSWSLMNDVVAQRTIERRAIQGISIRAGEIEFMQFVATPGLLIFGCLLIMIILWHRQRFK
jgi:hypothetical protein